MQKPKFPWQIYAVGLAVGTFTCFLSDRLFRNETIWDDAFAGAIAAIVVVGFLYQREINRREIEKQRFEAFRATMVTVQDVLGNLLNSLQLIRLEIEEVLPAESVALFDQLIQEADGHIKALGMLDHLETKPMAIGTGIKYQTPAQNAAHEESLTR